MGCGPSTDATVATTNTPAPGPNGAPPAGGGGPAAAPRSASGLRLPPKFESKPPMTSFELTAKREEFWHTRVDNDPTTWSNLKVAAEALIEGDLDTASAIVEATALRIGPSGTLACCYDERGREYRVPEHCYSTPTNIVGAGGAKSSVPIKTAAEVTKISWKLRLRVAPEDTDFALEMDNTSTIAELKEALIKHSDIKPDSVVAQNTDRSKMRIMHQGSELKDPDLLCNTKVTNNSVVQIFVRR